MTADTEGGVLVVAPPSTLQPLIHVTSYVYSSSQIKSHITSDQSPSVQSSRPFSRMLCLSTASSDAVHVTAPPPSLLMVLDQGAPRTQRAKKMLVLPEKRRIVSAGIPRWHADCSGTSRLLLLLWSDNNPSETRFYIGYVGHAKKGSKLSHMKWTGVCGRDTGSSPYRNTRKSRTGI